MPYNYWDLGQCSRGDVWRVELDRAANVFLVDSSNFSAFKGNRSFTHFGGLIQRSPHDFVIPRSGRWYLVAHTWGLRHTARISIQRLQIPQAMAPAQPHLVNLQSIAQNAAVYSGSEGAPPVAPTQKQHDAFISHASEDKEAIVRPLAEALVARGLDVWYDEFALRVGSSLRRTIDAGLATVASASSSCPTSSSRRVGRTMSWMGWSPATSRPVTRSSSFRSGTVSRRTK